MNGTVLPTMAEIRSLTDLPVFKVEDAIPWMEGPAMIGNNTPECVMEFAKASKASVVLV